MRNKDLWVHIKASGLEGRGWEFVECPTGIAVVLPGKWCEQEGFSRNLKLGEFDGFAEAVSAAEGFQRAVDMLRMAALHGSRPAQAPAPCNEGAGR